MEPKPKNTVSESRRSALEMSPEEFRALGYRLVDQVAEFLRSLPNRRVSTAESPSQIRGILGNSPLPEQGTAPGPLIGESGKAAS